MFTGLCLVPSLASAADIPGRAIPGEPPAGTPAALPTGPVPAPEPAPTAPPFDTGTTEVRLHREGQRRLLNVDVEGASAYVWRGINMFGENQNTDTRDLKAIGAGSGIDKRS
jgi:hypothetical protein